MMLIEDKATRIIELLKYYLKNRKVHMRNTYKTFAWYAYTMYDMELAMEEMIWAKTVA
jgi:hypothetical protein